MDNFDLKDYSNFFLSTKDDFSLTDQGLRV